MSVDADIPVSDVSPPSLGAYNSNFKQFNKNVAKFF